MVIVRGRRGLSTRGRPIFSLRLTAIRASLLSRRPRRRIPRRRSPRRRSPHFQADVSHPLKIPDHLLSDIFLRLPLCDVCRCRSVCWEWRYAIAERTFSDSYQSLYYSSPLIGLFSSTSWERNFHYIGLRDIGLEFNLSPLCNGHGTYLCSVKDSRWGCVLLEHRAAHMFHLLLTYYIPVRCYRRDVGFDYGLFRSTTLCFATLLPGDPPHDDFHLLILVRQTADYRFRLHTYDSITGLWTSTYIHHAFHVPRGYFSGHPVLVDGIFYGCCGPKILAIDVTASLIRVSNPPIPIPASSMFFALARTEFGRLCFVRLFSVDELSIHTFVMTSDEWSVATWSEAHVTDLSDQVDSTFLDQIANGMNPIVYRASILGFGERSGVIVLQFWDALGSSVYTFHLTTGRLERRTRFEGQDAGFFSYATTIPYEMDFPTF